MVDVEQIALSLPNVEVTTKWRHRTWTVNGKGFVWERPLTKADIKRLGNATPPDGEIAAVCTEDLHEKEAILAGNTKGFFTIEHFNNYPAFLIQLKVVSKRALKEAIIDAWLACAPPKLTEKYLSTTRTKRS